VPALPDLLQALEKAPGSPELFRTIVALKPQANSVAATLKKLMLDPCPRVRLLAADAWWRIDGSAEDVMPIIVDALPRVEGIARSSPLRLLVELGSAARDTVPFLMQLLVSGDGYTQWQCLCILAAIGPDAREAASALADYVMDPERKVYRADAVAALGCLRHEGEFALPLLRALLTSDKELLIVRANAAVAIWQISGDGTEGIPVIQQTLAASGETAELLKALGDFGPAAQPLAPAIQRLATKKYAFHRYEAIRALRQINGDVAPVLPVLIQIASDDGPVFACKAIDFLGELGPAAQDAIPVLTECLKDESWRIRKSAAQALERIQAANLKR
jgi:HEAT repeat protein